MRAGPDEARLWLTAGDDANDANDAKKIILARRAAPRRATPRRATVRGRGGRERGDRVRQDGVEPADAVPISMPSAPSARPPACPRAEA